jgi:hypothetical protein
LSLDQQPNSFRGQLIPQYPHGCQQQRDKHPSSIGIKLEGLERDECGCGHTLYEHTWEEGLAYLYFLIIIISLVIND